MRKKMMVILLLLIVICFLFGCWKKESQKSEEEYKNSTTTQNTNDVTSEKNNVTESEETQMKIQIQDIELTATMEDNEAVTALMELLQDGPLTIQMSSYGGFEQVGNLPQSLPRNDVQTKTSAGDIVLYSGDSIVMFYGSNSWAYTRLGKINNKTAEELQEILGNGDVEITLSVE